MDASAQETLLPSPKSLMRRYALTVWFSRSQSTKEHSTAASLPTPLQGSEPLQWPPTASDDPAKPELQSGSPTQPQDGSSCPGVSQQVCEAERLRGGDTVVKGLVKSGASGRDIGKEVGTAPGRNAAMPLEAADGSNALLRWECKLPYMLLSTQYASVGYLCQYCISTAACHDYVSE